MMKKEILKLDLADLDFGIHRILNYRRAEIERFFDEGLPALLDEALTHDGEARRRELEEQLAEAREAPDKAAVSLGFEGAFSDGEVIGPLAGSPIAAKYDEARKALEALGEAPVFAESEEDRLYNVLYTFFSRYYRDGDFQPQQRRARNARYSVPYNGEDVHFHWRSKGSHYVKTTEELKSYSFRSGDWRVRFELVEAFQEPDNVKGSERFFFPMPEECRQEAGEDGNLFVVPFAFRRLTDKEEKRYKKKNDELEGDSVQERIINDIAPGIDLPVGLVKKDLVHHLHRYAKKNRTDYFVHPNLGPFLRDELDYFLKNEYLDIDGLTSVEAMADRLTKMRVLRKVAHRIIDMLHEIESFQARLFEKRKFVLSTTYLVPIRMVPEELWDDILANEAQIQQWRDDFALKGKVDRRVLATHPTLVVDTGLCGRSFQEHLLSSFNDIAALTDAFLVECENYGALRTLFPTLDSSVSVVYMDPPYNTGNDGFLYKDDFSRHSAWLTMMDERLALCGLFLQRGGIVAVSIDDVEKSRLDILMERRYVKRIGCVTVLRKRGADNSAESLSRVHDYLLFYGSDESSGLGRLPLMESTRGAYRNPDNDPRGAYRLLGLWARGGQGGSSYSYNMQDGYDFSERLWLVNKETMQRLEQEDRLVRRGDRLYRKLFLTETSGSIARTIWDDVSNNADAADEIKKLFGELVFGSPKPRPLVERIVKLSRTDGVIVDPFAGSGTTGHAVIEEVRSSGVRRGFVLIEMGEHFDAVLKRRIAKVMYAPEWKDGAPKAEPKFDGEWPEWVERSPRLVQVIKLESYEDSLNSLTVGDEGQIGDELRIRYVIPDSVDESPCLLDTKKLEHPFAYQLEVHTEEGVRYVEVDLVTTFNLIKGIRPKRYRELDHEGRRYVVVEGREGGEEVLVVWRDIGDLDPGAERTFLGEAIPVALGKSMTDYARVYHNADSALPNSVSLDAEFKRLFVFPPGTDRR